MDDVYDIIRHAGRIPLAELVLRSSDPPEAVTKSIEMLIRKGLVSVRGPMPSDPAELGDAKDTIIELTTRGFSAAV